MSEQQGIEIYTPSASELEHGKWAVVYEDLFEDGTPDQSSYAHVIPMYGANHHISFQCWCNPERSALPGGNGLHYYIHTASQ